MSKAPTRSAPPPPPAENGASDGATPNERLLAAAKTDNEELLLEAFGANANVNYADGLGNTALHYAVKNASTDVLEYILNHDDCDPDLRNRLDGDTPLHIAVRDKFADHPGARLYMVALLLEGGADQLMKNSHNEKPGDALPSWHANVDPESDDEKVRDVLRSALAQQMVASSGDVVVEDDIVDENDIASDSD